MTARKIKPKKPASEPRQRNGLDDEIRTEIVTRLALYDTVTEIHADLNARGIEIAVQSVSHYSPNSNRKMADRWMQLFEQTRAQYHAEVAAVPIGNRVWRLRKLQRLYTAAEKKGALVIAAGFLEQAAREAGGQFTNVSKVAGKVDHTHVVDEVSPDERRNMLADRLKEGLARRAAASTKH